MTPKGNSRANGISERESNNEANCEADCNIARHNLAGAFSAGGDGRAPGQLMLDLFQIGNKMRFIRVNIVHLDGKPGPCAT
jgi:hypothetical protein